MVIDIVRLGKILLYYRHRIKVYIITRLKYTTLN